MLIINFLFALFISFGFGQSRVDGVAAMVGSNIVLHSDVLQQAQFIAMDRGINPSKNPYLFEKIYFNSLESLINQYVVLAVAEKDTNLIISNEEIDRALDQQIDSFVLRAGSESLFLEMAGMSMRDIRKDYWKDIRDMMYVERFQYSKIQNVDVSRVEVVDFYKVYKDSLPRVPENYSFSVIEVPFAPSEETDNKAISFLNKLRDNIIKNGEGFDSLAIKHSDDPGSASSGGFLGFTKRGSLVKEFEQAAYSMEIGEISYPIKSKFGFHLIKLIDKQGEKISTQHILKLTSFSEKDKGGVFNKVDSIYRSINGSGVVFDSLAVHYSNKFKNLSGVFIKKGVNEIPEYIYSEIKKGASTGLLSPKEGEGGVVLIFLYKHELAIVPDLDNSWEIVYSFAKQKKQNDIFTSFVNKVKKTTYIKIFN